MKITLDNPTPQRKLVAVLDPYRSVLWVRNRSPGSTRFEGGEAKNVEANLEGILTHSPEYRGIFEGDTITINF